MPQALSCASKATHAYQGCSGFSGQVPRLAVHTLAEIFSVSILADIFGHYFSSSEPSHLYGCSNRVFIFIDINLVTDNEGNTRN